MAMIKFLLIIIFCISAAQASDISDAFKRKDFRRISDIYRNNQRHDFSKKDLIFISYSLRKLGFYRQDIKLNIRLIKKHYPNYHKKILIDVKKGRTIDSDEYPNALKVLYWNLMNDYGRIIESYKDASTLIKKDHQHYLVFSKILSELEFREGKVDKFNDQIVSHIQYLENKVYKFSASISFQYISWQNSSTLESATSKASLIVTNRGLCLGGDAGIENSFYHFYVDGCAFAGSGGVSADASSPITYQQSNIPAYGLKFGPGASMIVSSSGSRIGLRVPIIYNLQKLQEPTNPAFKINSESPLAFVASLYSRWQFQRWYFQTEFGKYIQTEQTFWGLGIGKNF
jgi:hypothetical protein